MLAPVVLFVYNRLKHTSLTVEALQKNDLAQESDLIIFSDSFKDERDRESVLEVRKFLSSITGFKSIKIIKRFENYGLSKSVISGVTEVISKYGKVIVLEDDIVTSPYFLRYMNRALDMYENEDLVISIHGYVYPVKDILPETFFIKTADCWGWATWERGWSLFETDSQKLLSELKEKKLTREFDFNNSISYTKMLKNQINGVVDSWAIRWYASAFLKNKLTLFPGRSLVHNIGFDFSGRHCDSTSVFDTVIGDKIDLEKIKVEEDMAARKKFEEYFFSVKYKKILEKFKSKNIIFYIFKGFSRLFKKAPKS